MSDQIEQVQALENFHGLEAGSLAKIVSGEAVEVNLDNYRPAADFDTYKNNIDTDFESKKEELKDIYRKEGIERDVKNIRNTKGWDFEGKNVGSILQHQEKLIRAEYSENADARVNNLTEEKTNLQAKIEELKLAIEAGNQETENIRLEYKGKEDKVFLSNSLRSAHSEFKDKTDQDEDDLAVLFFNKYTPNVDGKNITFLDQDGKVRKDDLENPLGLKEVYSEFMSTRLKKPTGGTGGGDDLGNGRKPTMDEFIKSKEAQGLSQAEIMDEATKLASDGKISF